MDAHKFLERLSVVLSLSAVTGGLFFILIPAIGGLN
jgi:hypothetical protein